MITEQNSLILDHTIFQKKKIVALVLDTIACACTHTQFPEIIIVVVINLTLSGIHLLRNFLKKKKETS